MKLTKEQTQKLALGGVMLCVVVYAYFNFGLSPLAASREKAGKDLTAVEPQIKDAQAQLARTKALEIKEPAAQHLLDQVKAMTPDGSPIAWFPTRITDSFKKDRIEKASVRMVNEFSEKELPGFSRITWAVDVPRVEFITLAGAISSIENAEPLVEVQGFEIEAGRDDALNQRASLNLASLVHL
jgi:hypothetical protein